MAAMSDAKRPLPAGWRWVRLGELISEALPGFASGARDPHGVIQLRMNNVDTNGNLVWDEFLRVPADEETITKYRLTAGDVMFNNTNSTALVGKSALFGGYSEPVVYSNHFTRLRTKSECLTPDYLAAWLVWQWHSHVFAELCNQWIGQSAVKSDKLLVLEIPLPPLPVQRRIAAILNEQMAAVERARAACEAQLAAINRLPAALLRQAFRGEL
jgi:type I restriction enzyme S subunit